MLSGIREGGQFGKSQGSFLTCRDQHLERYSMQTQWVSAGMGYSPGQQVVDCSLSQLGFLQVLGNLLQPHLRKRNVEYEKVILTLWHTLGWNLFFCFNFPACV